MKKEYEFLIEEFKKVSKDIEKEIDECLLYWDPDTPPITIIFASIGRKAFEHFDQITSANKNLFFNLIEIGITSSNIQISNAIATGLLEAIVNRSVTTQEKWVEFNSGLQVNSKKYVNSYLSLM